MVPGRERNHVHTTLYLDDPYPWPAQKYWPELGAPGRESAQGGVRTMMRGCNHDSHTASPPGWNTQIYVSCFGRAGDHGMLFS